jgi:hypothetical protein
VLKAAFANLHDAIGNILCLYTFIKKYTGNDNIEYTLYIHALHRTKEIEAIMEKTLNYPVFGKEIDMGDKNKLYSLIKSSLGINKIGYLDSLGECKGNCVDENLRLFELSI